MLEDVIICELYIYWLKDNFIINKYFIDYLKAFKSRIIIDTKTGLKEISQSFKIRKTNNKSQWSTYVSHKMSLINKIGIF